MFRFDVRHQAKRFHYSISFDPHQNPYEMGSIITDWETEDQSNHVLKITALVCRGAFIPVHHILPTVAVLQKRKESFESENNILILKAIWLQVQSRDRSCPQV